MFILCINPYKIIPSFHLRDRIGGVMVSVLALSAVDCGFDPQSGQAAGIIKQKCLAMIGLKNCSLGIKQKQINHSI
jgi:hypothetical protein